MGNKVPYPWLASQDLKRFQTDREILEQLIDLSESSLTPSMKEEFYELLEEYKKYFSLYDELGLVQRMGNQFRVYRHVSVTEDIKSKAVKEDIKSRTEKKKI